MGFAKLQGIDFEYYLHNYELTFGRKSKTKGATFCLGNNLNISRQHARLHYSFENGRYELEARLALCTALLLPRPLSSSSSPYSSSSSFSSSSSSLSVCSSSCLSLSSSSLALPVPLLSLPIPLLPHPLSPPPVSPPPLPLVSLSSLLPCDTYISAVAGTLVEDNRQERRVHRRRAEDPRGEPRGAAQPDGHHYGRAVHFKPRSTQG